MAITVSIAFSNGTGTAGQALSGGGTLHAMITVANASASAVTLTECNVYAVPASAPVLIGKLMIPQGGYSIDGSSSRTLPSVRIVSLAPERQAMPASATGSSVAIGATVVVSDGSVGNSGTIVLETTPADTSIPPNALASPQTLLPGSTNNYQYSNVNYPGQLRFDQPLNSYFIATR